MPFTGFTVTAQFEIGLPLSVNVTIPERVAVPAAALTVAVKVTDSLIVDGLADDASASVVVAGPTVCMIVAWLDV